MRVALVLSGLDHACRGYETFTAELFQALNPHVWVDLLKGSGSGASHQVAVACLRRDSLLYDWLATVWQPSMDQRFI